ncbi:MAG: TonB-dependent receptor plug domain-containing protein, partial [Gammaproteobacteria bacterium]
MNLLKKTALGLAIAASSSVTLASDVLEEVIVTARQQAEGLQDVPVTIAAMTEEDLDRYNITNLVDAAKMVPNMVIAQGGSGNGSSLRLRGIGSSSISAAFDHSVAINLDGVVVNRGRFIHNSYMDMSQLEVLKGPQSLYFGKSATAGVVSIMTNDPGDEFEFQLSGGVETEYDGTFYEMVISGPLTDTLGARLAIGGSKNDELFENYSAENDPNAAINGAEKYYGDESTNMRLTLVWEPTDNFKAKLKYNYSEFDNDGAGTAYTEEVCPEGAHQPTLAVGILFQG